MLDQLSFGGLHTIIEEDCKQWTSLCNSSGWQVCLRHLPCVRGNCLPLKSFLPIVLALIWPSEVLGEYFWLSRTRFPGNCCQKWQFFFFAWVEAAGVLVVRWASFLCSHTCCSHPSASPTPGSPACKQLQMTVLLFAAWYWAYFRNQWNFVCFRGLEGIMLLWGDIYQS